MNSFHPFFLRPGLGVGIGSCHFKIANCGVHAQAGLQRPTPEGPFCIKDSLLPPAPGDLESRDLLCPEAREGCGVAERCYMQT